MIWKILFFTAWFAVYAFAQGDPPGDPAGLWILNVSPVNGSPCQVCRIILTLPTPDDGAFPAAALGSSNLNGLTAFGYGSWSKSGAATATFRFTEAMLAGGYTTVSGTLVLNPAQPEAGTGSGTLDRSWGGTFPYSFTATKVPYPGQADAAIAGNSAANGRPRTGDPVHADAESNPSSGDFVGNWAINLGGPAGDACGCTILLHADAPAVDAPGGTLLVDAPFAGSTGAIGLWTLNRAGEYEIVVNGLAFSLGGIPVGLRHFEGKFRVESSNPLQPTAAGSGMLTMEPGQVQIPFLANGIKLDTTTQF